MPSSRQRDDGTGRSLSPNLQGALTSSRSKSTSSLDQEVEILSESHQSSRRALTPPPNWGGTNGGRRAGVPADSQLANQIMTQPSVEVKPHGRHGEEIVVSGLSVFLGPELSRLEDEIKSYFHQIVAGYQHVEKMKDPGRQTRVLEELTAKMRECRRCIKEFEVTTRDADSSTSAEMTRARMDRKNALVKELNGYVAMKKTFQTAISEGQKVEVVEGGGEAHVISSTPTRNAAMMTSNELIQEGQVAMDETDATLERSRMVVEETLNIGTETAATLKQQTAQMGHIVDELENLQMSLKQAGKVLRQLARQMATDKCIMSLFILILVGVIAIIVLKIVGPKHTALNNVTALDPLHAPPAARKLLRSFHV